MNKWRWLAVWLPLLLGGAEAQSGMWTVYFVFRLATSLPLTLQATPECVAERVAWERDLAAPGPRLLETYSFVSPLSGGVLWKEIEATAQEGEFTATDLRQEDTSAVNGAAGREAPGRKFQGRIAPGYHYAVRVYERPGGAETASILCLTVLADPGVKDPTPAVPGDD